MRIDIEAGEKRGNFSKANSVTCFSRVVCGNRPWPRMADIRKTLSILNFERSADPLVGCQAAFRRERGPQRPLAGPVRLGHDRPQIALGEGIRPLPDRREK